MPPWYVVYQQMQRWLQWGCFEILVEDVRSLVREWAGRKGQPTAVCIDSRTLQSTPESGAHAGYDGAKRRKGSKVHIAVDTLGWKSSSTRWPNAASCCCPAAGWSNEASPGQRASDDLPETTHGSTLPPKG